MSKFITAINCMDGRVQEPVIKYLKNKYNAEYVDMITQPGPNKILATEEDQYLIENIKKCIGISVNGHGSNSIFVIGHYDCAGNPSVKEVQVKQTSKAVKLISSWFPKTKVFGLWVNENWEIEQID